MRHIDSEATIGNSTHARLVGIEVVEHGNALFDAEHGCFLYIHTNGNYYFVKNIQRAGYDRMVSASEGVECAGKNGYSLITILCHLLQQDYLL